MSLRDWARSQVRRAADNVVATTANFAPLREVLDRIEQIRKRESIIEEATLTAAVVRTRGVRAATVTCSTGFISVDAAMESGNDYSFRVVPLSSKFASGGVKEVRFQAEPPDRVSTEVVGAIAACIARATWPMMFRGDASAVGVAIMDRDESGLLRTDLKSVPALRTITRGGPQAMLLDLLDIESIRVSPGRITLRLRFAAGF